MILREIHSKYTSKVSVVWVNLIHTFPHLKHGKSSSTTKWSIVGYCSGKNFFPLGWWVYARSASKAILREGAIHSNSFRPLLLSPPSLTPIFQSLEKPLHFHDTIQKFTTIPLSNVLFPHLPSILVYIYLYGKSLHLFQICVVTVNYTQDPAVCTSL